MRGNNGSIIVRVECGDKDRYKFGLRQIAVLQRHKKVEKNEGEARRDC